MFVGTVLGITPVQPRDGWPMGKVRIRIDESFGGLAPGAHEVDVMTGSGNGDCGVPFKTGDVYLVDASAEEDGVLYAGICSNTRKIDEAGAMLFSLRQRRDRRKLPSLIGQIVQTAPDFKDSSSMEDPKPLPGTRIRLKRGTKTYRARSDDAGVYAFYGLPPGDYQMDADLPHGVTWSWDSDDVGESKSFELHAACQQQWIQSYPSGSIEGRVLDPSDEPVRDGPVFIIPAGQQFSPGQTNLVFAFQGKDGSFKLIHLPPGEYVILVNPADLQGLGFPYPRTFAPGKHDRESAAIVTVHAGEHVTNADIHVGREFKPAP